MAPPEPLDDFPLPQELKDQIWAYLMGGEVKQKTAPYGNDPEADESTWGVFKPRKVTTTTYRHHTAICNVNKTIGRNASHFLAQRKVVLVRFNCPYLQLHLDLMGVPAIATRPLDSFVNHSFEIDIDWPTGPLGDESSKVPGQRGSRLLLERDMPQFWTVLRLLCQRIIPDRVVIASAPGRPLQLIGNHAERAIASPVVRITARDTQNRTLTAHDLNRFLDPIESVPGIGYKILFRGFDKVTPRVFEVARLIAPDVIFASAMQLNQLEVLRQVKKKADEHAIHGDFEAAESVFRCLYAHCLFFTDTSKPVETVATTSLKRLTLDTLLSIAWLTMRRGESEWAADHISRAFMLAQQAFTVSRQIPRLSHMHTLSMMFLVEDASRGPREFSRRIPRVLWLLKAIPYSSRRVRYDIKLLERTTSERQERLREKILAGGFSIKKYPFLEFHSHTSIQPAPETIGWQDMKHLQELSGEDKAAIHALEKKCRFPISSI